LWLARLRGEASALIGKVFGDVRTWARQESVFRMMRNGFVAPKVISRDSTEADSGPRSRVERARLAVLHPRRVADARGLLHRRAKLGFAVLERGRTWLREMHSRSRSEIVMSRRLS